MRRVIKCIHAVSATKSQQQMVAFVMIVQMEFMVQMLGLVCQLGIRMDKDAEEAMSDTWAATRYA